ncbi:MAG TPA: exodeoxyribonuclease VII small subunit [Ignavibacteria bacterium]|nr:exodeoxyribonuclease VII small subunit [Ignavibacteria bacterium]HMR39383.1 exodeoxyribonuclease VII small subunit [Ignavibacteria bacterium]
MKKKKEETLFDENVSFEKSFKRLEEILNQLENDTDDFSIEEMIKNYQEGLKLLKICRTKLNEAELKIEKISTEQEN